MLAARERAIASREARAIYRLVADRLGEDYFDGCELRVTTSDSGRAVLVAVDEPREWPAHRTPIARTDRLFALDEATGEPICCARVDGRPQVGYVVRGEILWGHIPVIRPPSMN